MCPSGRYPSLGPAAAAASGFRPAFDVLDSDRDGKISRDDLKSFCSSAGAFGSAMSEEDIASMIAAADYDRNGYVEFEEFERVLRGKPRRSGSGERLMEEVFRMMDKDGDGRVGFEDLREYLQSAGIEVGDEEVRAMIGMSGGDEKDGVRFEGLLRILAVDLP